jgi:hypothetical protein
MLTLLSTPVIHLCLAVDHRRNQGVQGVQVHPQPNVMKQNVSALHKMLQIKHFLLTKLMNYRHTYLASYALKLLYGNL